METLSGTSLRTAAESDQAWRERAFLDELQRRVGTAGLDAARHHPALLAAVSQHGAAVRDWLTAQGLDVRRPALAGYAAVLLLAAQRCGRLLPREPGAVDWPEAEWYLLRLLGVCALTEDQTTA